MKEFKYITLKFSLILGISILFTSSVFATGATAIISSAATTVSPIPTLSETMLIVLSLLLLTVTFRISRQKNNGSTHFFTVLVGITALVTGGSGIKLITNVKASGSTTEILLLPQTQSYRLLNDLSDSNSGFNGFIRNNSGQLITLRSITPDLNTLCEFSSSPSSPCNGSDIPLGSTIDIPDGSSCFISCSLISNHPS